MMHLEFVFPGKTREGYLAAGIDDFRSRLSNFAEIEIKVLKEVKPGRKPELQVRREEGQALLARLAQKTLVVALEPDGRALNSEELAGLLAQWEEGGQRHLTFLVGGALGLAPEVLDRADYRLSLSRMTFTHEMARLILLEQLYRAFNIRAGTAYHK